MIPDDDLKSRKEAFVTGHGGSDHPWEVLWVCTSVLWGCWLYAEWAMWMQKQQSKDSNANANAKQQRTTVAGRFAAEACLVWLPVIVAQTEYLYPIGSLLMVGQIVLASILFSKRTTTTHQHQQQHQQQTQSPSQSQSQQPLLYLTLYRSSVYVLTFVAILAVDFPLFPRRFCKTEISGYGLMDVGAASFVISGGIVCGKAYVAKQPKQNNSNGGSNRKNNYISIVGLFRPLSKAAPLIAIGIIRCITNKELEYQEHVSEYGMHWNFFFTLGVLAVVSAIRRTLLLQLASVVSTNTSSNSNSNSSSNDNDNNHTRRLMEMIQRWVFWAPLLAIVLYQYELVFGRDDANGLEKFILTAPRTPLLDCENESENESTATASAMRFLVDRLVCLWMRFLYANREGILGCIGYSFLHAAGEWVGQTYVFGGSSEVCSSSSSCWPLAKLTASAWIALYSLNYVFHVTVSRRETNLSFCLWAIAHNLTILLGFKIMVATERTSDSKSHNENENESGAILLLGPGFGAFNRHGMASFLVANLLTGFINLLVPTIDQGNGVAIGIVLVYLLAVGGVALGLDRRVVGSSRSSNSNKKKETTMKKTN